MAPEKEEFVAGVVEGMFHISENLSNISTFIIILILY